MGAKEKNKSLLEIAIDVLTEKHQKQPIKIIAAETFMIKGIKSKDKVKELLPQFLLDFQTSGYFVYCGDGCWDLKERQPTSVLDKDSSDYDMSMEEDSEVVSNQLGYDDLVSNSSEENDDEENERDEDDDIKSALEENGELDSEDDVQVGYEDEEDEDEE